MKRLLALALVFAPLASQAQNAVTQDGTVQVNKPTMWSGDRRIRQGAGENGGIAGRMITGGEGIVGKICAYSDTTDKVPPPTKFCLRPDGSLEFNGIPVPLDGSGPTGPTVVLTAAGGKCDGTTPDDAAFTTAFNAMPSGGILVIPATGHSCVVSAGINVPDNVRIMGVSGPHHLEQPQPNVEAYAAGGSAIKCLSTTNSCLTLGQVGNVIEGVNFLFQQPAPIAGWSPTIYPYAITITGNAFAVRHVSFVGASHCIAVEGAGGGNIGKYSSIEHVYFDGCFQRGVRLKNVDNTMAISHSRFTPYWNLNQPGIIPYMVANKIDLEIQYASNLNLNDVEFFLSKCGMAFTDSTVVSGFGTITFAAQEMRAVNLVFNEVAQATCMTGGPATYVSGLWSNVSAYGDSVANSYAGKPLFDFNSNNIFMTINGLNVGYSDTVLSVGGGTAGTVKMSGIDVQQYSMLTPGQAAFNINAGALLSTANTIQNAIRPAAGAGPRFTGAGYPTGLNYFSGRTNFTPGLVFGGGNTGMTGTFTGQYELNDKTLTFETNITLTAKGSSTGAAQITGLPFQCQGTGIYSIAAYGNMAGMTSASISSIQPLSNVVPLSLAGPTNTLGMSDANFTNTSQFNGNGHCVIQ